MYLLFLLFIITFGCRSQLILRGKRHRIRTRHPNKQKTTPLENHLHRRTTRSSGARFRPHAVPGRLHQRGVGAKDQTDRSSRPSVVFEPQSAAPQAAQLAAAERFQYHVSAIGVSGPTSIRGRRFRPERLGPADLRVGSGLGHCLVGQRLGGHHFEFHHEHEFSVAKFALQLVQQLGAGAVECVKRCQSVRLQHGASVPEPT